MAVFTKVDRAELEAFLTTYDIGTLESFEGIAQGIENTNYHLFTSKGRYILTIFEKRVRVEDLPFIFAYQNHLSSHEIVCPQVVANRNREEINFLKDKAAAITTFLHGKDLTQPEITPQHCRELGRVQAQMHLAAYDFEMRRENGVGFMAWKAMADDCRDRADEVYPGLAQMIDDELAYLAAHLPHNLPSGAVHADMFPDNVFFQDEKLSGVIDFYFSCTAEWVYDLAITVNAWCFDKERRFMPECYDALKTAYMSARPLTDQEADFLPLYCRAAALRFLMTRLSDWLFHPGDEFVTPKDPIDYIERLKFFRDDKALQQKAC